MGKREFIGAITAAPMKLLVAAIGE